MGRRKLNVNIETIEDKFIDHLIDVDENKQANDMTNESLKPPLTDEERCSVVAKAKATYSQILPQLTQLISSIAELEKREVLNVAIDIYQTKQSNDMVKPTIKHGKDISVVYTCYRYTHDREVHLLYILTDEHANYVIEHNSTNDYTIQRIVGSTITELHGWKYVTSQHSDLLLNTWLELFIMDVLYVDLIHRTDAFIHTTIGELDPAIAIPPDYEERIIEKLTKMLRYRFGCINEKFNGEPTEVPEPLRSHEYRGHKPKVTKSE